MSSSKWDAYYAEDAALKTPWDSHAEASQLRAYLTMCPAAACKEDAAQAPPSPFELALSGRSELGREASLPAAYHVCPCCSHLKPYGRALAHRQQQLAGETSQQAAALGPPLMLELCCGTGASLGFSRRLGFACMGVDVVAAACDAARQRLREATPSPSAPPSPTRQQSAAHAAPAAPEPGAGPVPPLASVLHGDVFEAQLPWGQVDLVYDCQGLHAMPAERRPAYAAILQRALRPGGFLLLLVGRDAEGEPAPWERRADDAQPQPQSAACGDGSSAGTGKGSPAAASRPGPSCMSRHELEQLFPAPEWRWHLCAHSRFDETPYYTTLPRLPPAWCLLLQTSRAG